MEPADDANLMAPEFVVITASLTLSPAAALTEIPVFAVIDPAPVMERGVVGNSALIVMAPIGSVVEI